MANKSLRELVNRAIEKLPGDLGTVLALRYGLGDNGRLSTGKIAKRLNIKISQVARVEMKAIRNLRKPTLCAPFFGALDETDPIIWHEISEEISEAGSLVRKSDNYDMLTRALPGEISLAIICRYGSLRRWIECNAFESENVWFRSKYSAETVLDKLRRFISFWKEIETPVMVAHLTRRLQMDTAFLSFILALSPWAAGFYDGYTAQRPITPFVLRAIRLHLLLLYQYADNCMNLDNTVKNYNSLYHDDKLTDSLAESIMRSRPHLFIESSYRVWSVLGSVREHALYVHVDDVAPGGEAVEEDVERKTPAFFYKRPWSETTASHIVRGILEERGFCRQKQVADLFLERSEGRYERVSAEASLTLDDDFLEVAPRVYGLRENCMDMDPVSAWSEILLTRKACKRFVLDRYAGEPLNVYPLWTSVMEHQWCIWAENNSELNLGIGFGGESDRAFNRKLFQSLLFVSEPERWPVPDSIKAQWLFKKEALSTYHFNKDVRYPLWQRKPSLQDLFSVAVTSKELGYANWIRTSHALGLGRHSPHAAGALILLIALEMILPADNWQRKHKIGPQIESDLRIMEKEIKKKGFVHWMDETGEYFRNRLRKGMNHVQLGWGSPDRIGEFLDLLEGKKIPDQAVEKPSSHTKARALIRNAVKGNRPTEAPEQLTLPF